MIMGDLSITWRGRSSDELGVVIQRLPPITSPTVRRETVVVPGRPGTLHYPSTGDDEILLPVQGYLPYEQDGYNVASLDVIKEWLSGTGELAVSDLPGRVYKAGITEAVQYTPWVVGFADRLFLANFWANPPYQYQHPPVTEVLTGPRPLTNPGNIPSAPTITVYGSGAVTLVVGTTVVQISSISGSIVIDCDAMTAYQPGTPKIPKTGSLSILDDIWPTLPVGSTQISWTGSVTKIEIQPQWRWR